MKKKIVTALVLAFLFPAALSAQGLHGNSITFGAGVLTGDSSFDGDGAEASFSWNIQGQYFLNDYLYSVLRYSDQRTSYKESSGGAATEVLISLSTLTTGIGYELPLDDGVALFGQINGLLGFGEIEQTGSSNTDIIGLGYLSSLGFRGRYDQLSWQAELGYSSLELQSENSDLSTSTESGLAFAGGALWELATDVLVGPSFTTDLDVHTISANLRLAF